MFAVGFRIHQMKASRLKNESQERESTNDDEKTNEKCASLPILKMEDK